jgi:hypothetical protein
MGPDKTFALIAAAMIFKLLTEKFVVQLQLSISCANTLAKMVNMVQNNSPHNISEEQEGYALQRYNSLHWSF